MAELPETQFAPAADGTSIAYQISGSGPIDVVLLVPGSCIDLMADDRVFGHVQDRLRSIGRLICFDWRGTGSSDAFAPGGLPTPEEWTDDIRAVLDAVGSAGAVVIAPRATGLLGILFAATHPARTRALVLIDAFARLLRAEDFPFGYDSATMHDFIELVLRGWGDPAAAAFGVPSRSDEEGFATFFARAQRVSMSPGMARAVWEWMVSLDVRSVLGAIRSPTLVLHHERNSVVPTAHAEYLAEHVDGAVLHVQPGPAEDFLLSAITCDEVVDAIEEFATGSPPVRDADRVLATVLFTDIVDSTSLLIEHGDRTWKTILDRHDTVVDRALERFHGRKVNSTGDGVLATFDGPARAVQCACAIRDGVAELGIQTRAGLHTGEVEIRGHDVSGVAVHLGARVAALAGPNEVLVTRTLTDLVAGSGLRFTERGEHELKGFPGSWSICAVAEGS